jgi:hypothetical protein
MLVFVHPNGTLVFWYVHHLSQAPRSEIRVQLASWTATAAIPVNDANTVRLTQGVNLVCGKGC